VANFLRDPTYRGKYVIDNLIWPEISLHMLRKLAGKETGDGTRHIYRPTDVRQVKLQHYQIDPATVPLARPPVINTRMAKGGVGKTTTSANLAAAFAFMGYRTLLIDGDPQASLTNMMGVDAATDENIVHIGALMEAAAKGSAHDQIRAAIRPIYPSGMLDLIPADITLVQTDAWLDRQLQRETVFERLLESHLDIFGRYDVILIDSAPGTSLLTVNLMLSCHTQLAVVNLDRECLKALPILFQNVQEINSVFKANASDVEIVANGLNAGHKLEKETLGLLIDRYGEMLNENVIPQSTAFDRQQSIPGEPAKGPLIEQDPSNPGAKAMLDLAKSLLGRYKIRLSGFDEAVPSTRG